jgi:hypothetical protein
MVFMTMVKNVAAPFFIMPLGSADGGGGTNGIYVFMKTGFLGLLTNQK